MVQEYPDLPASLQELSFIKIEDKYYRANELYDPQNPIFYILFKGGEANSKSSNNGHHFPPQQYSTSRWRKLLITHLGLKSEVLYI